MSFIGLLEDQGMSKFSRSLPHGKVILIALAILLMPVEQLSAQKRGKVEIVPLFGHSISCLAFSPDGARVLSGGSKTIKLWDVATGAPIRTFEGDPHWVNSVAFSPDGARVLSGGSDTTIKLWDAATGTLMRTFKGHSDLVSSVTFSPDGAHVLSGSDDNTIKLWDAATGALIRTFQGHSSWVKSVAFSPDGGRVLSGSEDKMIKLWDTASGELIRTFEGHSDLVSSVTFSAGGARVLSSSEDNIIKLWDTATGTLIRILRGHSDWTKSSAFSRDGTRVLVGIGDQTIKLWDTATGTLIRTFEGHSTIIISVAFSPDGGRVLSGSVDNTIKLWDAATGALIRTFKGHSQGIRSVAFSSGAASVLSTNFEEQTIKLWDAATGALIRTIKPGLALSPDGAHVLSVSGNTITLRNAATGARLRTFDGHTRRATSVAISPDGTRVLSGSQDHTIKLWDAVTGALIRTFNGHSLTIASLAFSADGARVLSASHDRTVKLWDAATGALMRSFEGYSYLVSSVAFSADGTRVLSGSEDNSIKLWDAATGSLIRTFQGHSSWVKSVAFSPDGGRVLSGSEDKTIKLWDTASGELIRTFEGHYDRVTSVAFSPDGARALSVSLDTTVRIWNLETGNWLVTLLVAGDGEWLAMTPAGFFAASHNGTEMLGIVRGLDVLSVGQVHQSLFSPDLLREALAGDPSGELQEAAKVMNLEKVFDSGPAPMVIITSHPTSNQSAVDLVSVEASVTDMGTGIGRLEWRINGVTTAVSTNTVGNGPDYKIVQQLALDPGDNVIEVVAYNGSNLLASLPARTTINFTGTDLLKPKLHILAIGIDKYIDRGWTPPGSTELVAFGPLGLAVKDATVVAEDLRRGATGRYADVSVTLALDEQASRNNLQRTIDKLAAEIHPRDTFILFAAAHGFSSNGRFYLIPQDHSGGSDPAALERSAIGQDRLQDWLANRIKAKKAVILLDTCESGALIAGHLRSRTEGPASEAGVGRLHEATGRPVLTAAASGEFAHEGVVSTTGVAHGIFTWTLLDALRNGDRDGNGLIELSEIVAHVQAKVPALAAELKRDGRAASVVATPDLGRQTARFGSRGEDFAVVGRLQ